MLVEHHPVFIETMADGIHNGAWMHNDERFTTDIIPRAYTSDLGVLRLRVKDLLHVTQVLKDKGFQVKQKSGHIEVLPEGVHDFNDILKQLEKHGIFVEMTAIIPGIYQG